MATNPFEVLGLQWGKCTEEDVIKAYRRLALLNHPDRVGTVGADRMQAINAARDTIIEQGLCSIPPPSEQRSYSERPSQRPSQRPSERDYSNRYNPRPAERGYNESYNPHPSGRQNDSARYNSRPAERNDSEHYSSRASERQNHPERFTDRPSGRRDDSERYTPRPAEREYSERHTPRPTERDHSEQYTPRPSGRRDDSERYNPGSARQDYSERYNRERYTPHPSSRQDDSERCNTRPTERGYSESYSPRPSRRRDESERDEPILRNVPGRWSPPPAARRRGDESDIKPRGLGTNIQEVDEQFKRAMPSVMRGIKSFLQDTRPRDTRTANTPWHTVSTLYHTLESILPELLWSGERVRICGLLGRLFFAIKLYYMWDNPEDSHELEKCCSLVSVIGSLDVCEKQGKGFKIPGWLKACLPDMERSWRQEAREHGI